MAVFLSYKKYTDSRFSSLVLLPRGVVYLEQEGCAATLSSTRKDGGGQVGTVTGSEVP